jgi:hypothetical protein
MRSGQNIGDSRIWCGVAFGQQSERKHGKGVPGSPDAARDADADHLLFDVAPDGYVVTATPPGPRRRPAAYDGQLLPQRETRRSGALGAGRVGAPRTERASSEARFTCSVASLCDRVERGVRPVREMAIFLAAGREGRLRTGDRWDRLE